MKALVNYTAPQHFQEDERRNVQTSLLSAKRQGREARQAKASMLHVVWFLVGCALMGLAAFLYTVALSSEGAQKFLLGFVAFPAAEGAVIAWVLSALYQNDAETKI